MDEIIVIENLTKKYGAFKAVNGVTFDVFQGETLGILGPNGAGKTTTLEMMEGLKQITRGTVTLAGINVAREPAKVKSLIGVQLQASSFLDFLSLKEILIVLASLYNRTVNPLTLLKKVELEDKIKSQVKELSGGQKQRFSIAAALVNNPRILFLDEPTTGLDPQARRHLWDLIAEIKKEGKTIVLTTHYMDEAEVLCDRVAIMDHAKIVALDYTPALLSESGVESTITFRADKADSVTEVEKLPAVTKVAIEKFNYRLISANPEKTLPALYALKNSGRVNLYNLQLRQPNLEDVFLKLTGKQLRE